jgi:arylsulfatase
MKKASRIVWFVWLWMLTAALPLSAQQKPNIVVIFGDDIGTWNVGAYTHGMMGRTPNIDRIAKEGALFTDHYGQPSCTAGRAAFLMGQLPIRTGMTTVGIPGSTQGIQKEDPTLAEVLKSQGYATAQFGKNHLGDRNEFLPTVHGFDEWFGNLYHLNAEEERRNWTIRVRRTPLIKRSSVPAVCSIHGQLTPTRRRLSRNSDGLASRGSRIRVP